MDLQDEYSNIRPMIASKIGRNLHLQTNHPIEIVKRMIYEYFDTLDRKFDRFDELSPVVSVEDNFDLLLIPDDHPARSRSDTYYVNKEMVLRTHTSAHQNQLLADGVTSFLVTGDVYRKDEVDRYHYPVFHQMEGVHLVGDGVDPKEDLIKVLSGLVETLFPGCEYRIRDHHFPFTDPSFEYDVMYEGEWMEILGCGLIHPDILAHHKITRTGWAWGIGLDRIAMRLFKIPDIRLLWSTHPRFLSQFKHGTVNKFAPFSTLPDQSNDISFWVQDGTYTTDETKPATEWGWEQENDLCEIIREVAGDNVKHVELIDAFYHPKKKRYSRCYRLHFSPLDPDMTNAADFTSLVLSVFRDTSAAIVSGLGVEIR